MTHIKKFNESTETPKSGNPYGIDDKWMEIYDDVKLLDLQNMDWIDVIVLLGREFNPPTKK